jgi:hypothetical protein
MPVSGTAGDVTENCGEHNGKDIREVAEDRKEGRRYASHHKEAQGWFLGIHCFAKYVKVAFFRGASLRPIPPGESRQKEVRYLDIHEDDELDEAQLAAWVKQASLLPGKKM